jgi:hypothetical protein
VSGELLTVASLNTRGIPLTGSQLAERYAAIGAGFDAGDADVVCCQEVLTYWHLRLMDAAAMSLELHGWGIHAVRTDWPGAAGRQQGGRKPPEVARAPGITASGRTAPQCPAEAQRALRHISQNQ